MTNEEATNLFKPIAEKMDADGDQFLFVHFSVTADKYRGQESKNMDAGDALIIIGHLIQRFNLSRKAVAQMDFSLLDKKKG